MCRLRELVGGHHANDSQVDPRIYARHPLPSVLEQLTKPLLGLRDGRRPSSAWSRVKLKG
jgi:hypothetical protein